MVDPIAVRAFGAFAREYDRGRPGWPPDAVAALLERFGSGTVLDLAAGTGKLTRVLAERADTVIAVEPVDGMRNVLRERLPHVRAMKGAAEEIPLPNASVDAVFVAEAFHWFDPRPAAAEIARVLKPGGGVAVLWNEAHLDGVAWSDELYRTVVAFRQFDTPTRDSSTAWRGALEAELGELHEEEADHDQVTGPDELLDNIASFSWVGGLEPERFREVMAAAREVIQRHGLDRVTIHFTTRIAWAQKRLGDSAGSAG